MHKNISLNIFLAFPLEKPVEILMVKKQGDVRPFSEHYFRMKLGVKFMTNQG